MAAFFWDKYLLSRIAIQPDPHPRSKRRGFGSHIYDHIVESSGDTRDEFVVRGPMDSSDNTFLGLGRYNMFPIRLDTCCLPIPRVEFLEKTSVVVIPLRLDHKAVVDFGGSNLYVIKLVSFGRLYG